MEHQEKQVSKVYKNSWKVYKVCDKFFMWDSFGSVTIDANTIVQVGESEYVNTLGDLSSSSEIPQLINGNTALTADKIPRIPE